MRTWHLATTAATLLTLAIWSTLWSPTRTALVDADLRHQVVAEDDEADLEDLSTRVAALETAVAALQTTVADFQAGVGESATTEATPTPTPAAPTTLTCGQPFASWGAATSDNVRVQLLQIEPGADADVAIEGADVYVVEVSIDNLRSEALTTALEDFVLLDCDGQTYTARPDGLEPTLAPGEVAPGNSARGWLTFSLPPGAQPAGFVYRVQSPGRSGAEVSCPLVNRDAPPAPLDAASGGAGCSARGGSAG
jgi:hypothetical protein